MRAVATEVCGCDSCALTTTGQPAASAEAVSPPATENAKGKFDAANTATGPTGRTIRRSPGTPCGRRAGDHVQVAAVGQHVAEHPQLAGGAGHLAGQPGAAQGGLGVGQRGQVAGLGVQRIGHRPQRRGPASRAERLPAVRGGGRRRGRGVHCLVGGLLDRLPGGLAGPRVISLDHEPSVLSLLSQQDRRRADPGYARRPAASCPGRPPFQAGRPPATQVAGHRVLHGLGRGELGHVRGGGRAGPGVAVLVEPGVLPRERRARPVLPLRPPRTAPRPVPSCRHRDAADRHVLDDQAGDVLGRVRRRGRGHGDVRQGDRADGVGGGRAGQRP